MFPLTQALARSAVQFSQAPAMLGEEETWHLHGKRVAQRAAILAARGFSRGDRLAIIGRNSAEQARVIHACYWGGFLPVPINWRLSAREIAEQLADCAPTLIVTDEAFEDLLPADLKRKHVLWRALTDDAAGVIDAVDANADDPALLIYTGGTTGRAKGVVLSHGNIVANAFQVGAHMRFTGQSRYLHVAPMFHSADLLGTAVTILGGAHAFLPEFSPKAFVEAVDRHRITHTMLPPTAIRFLLESEDTPQHGTLKVLIYGSSAMDAASIVAACDRFEDVSLLQGYGLTETSPLLTILGAEAHQRILSGQDVLAGSAGRALAGVELKLVDGEVLARGPNIACAYWNRPEETAQSFQDGWFRTGDLGRIDDAGYLYLLGRSKDMIVTGGENVYAIEVERVLAMHPAIREAAVIGLPDPTWGETVAAVIVAGEQPVDTDEIVQHCRAHLGGFKVPRRIILRDDLPRSALGKVLKHVLKKDVEGTA
ncbi:MAG: AMP-binding protein [Pseudomonadota bacterium]